ncbi:MAG: PhzF family phenazine biosynthesis protein [Bacteroidia bacterium]
MSFPFHILNVFAEGPYGGNQLAVFQLPEDMPAETLLRITRETNIAEAAFLIGEPDRKGKLRLRVFTHEAELPSAGHAALGAAFVAENRWPQYADKLELSMPKATCLIRRGDDGLQWLEQPSPIFADTLPIEALSPVLRLNPTVFHPDLPIQIVSTGLPFIMVPLRHLDAVKQATLHGISYYSLIRETQAKAIMLFAPQVYKRENDYNVRVFGDFFGVPEDAASGSANGCLGSYLLYHKVVGDPVQIRVEQGYEMKRPSLIQVEAWHDGAQSRVKVGGQVRVLVEGEWKHAGVERA